ncbi:MAG: hypothetical protein ACJZ78_02400 [Prochlorococcus marinus]
MENQNPSNEIDSSKQVTRSQSDSLDKNEPASEGKKDLNTLDKPEKSSLIK